MGWRFALALVLPPLARDPRESNQNCRLGIHHGKSHPSIFKYHQPSSDMTISPQSPGPAAIPPWTRGQQRGQFAQGIASGSAQHIIQCAVPAFAQGDAAEGERIVGRAVDGAMDCWWMVWCQIFQDFFQRWFNGTNPNPLSCGCFFPFRI